MGTLTDENEFGETDNGIVAVSILDAIAPQCGMIADICVELDLNEFETSVGFVFCNLSCLSLLARFSE